MVLSSVIYLQLSPKRLTLRNPKTGQTVSEVPEIAILPGDKPRVLAVGAEAHLQAGSELVQVINPFTHPRTLVSDFTVGEQVFKAFLRRIHPVTLWTLAPALVIHPLGDPEGGFTQIEIRALHEMGLSAGASVVTIWRGRTLTDQELLARQFPKDGLQLS